MKIALVAMTLALALLPCAAKTTAAEQVTSPQQAFGFAPGTDRKLADWKQLTSYYQTLARQSPRVRYAELGNALLESSSIPVALSGHRSDAASSEHISPGIVHGL